MNTEQPNDNNVHLIYRTVNSDKSESKEDDQDVQVREEGGQDGRKTVQDLTKSNDVFGANEFEKM